MVFAALPPAACCLEVLALLLACCLASLLTCCLTVFELLLTCCVPVFAVSKVTVVLVDVGGWMGLLWGEASWTIFFTGVTTG